MTKTQEKAKELVDRFIQYTPADEKFELPYAKKCVLICVNRNIKILTELREKEHSDNFRYIEEIILELQEVKQEIEKI